MKRAELHVRCWTLVGIACASTVMGCNTGGAAGPDPLRPQYYQLQFFNWNSLPARMMSGFLSDDHSDLDSATLIPYAVGRTVDQRFFGDRTGRGGTGGNTRDTTVARGQFMDIRVIKHVTGPQRSITFQRDSTVVDVEVRDTVVIIRRPHIVPRYAQVDTGYFASGMLVVPTVIRLFLGAPYGPRSAILAYRISRE